MVEDKQKEKGQKTKANAGGQKKTEE